MTKFTGWLILTLVLVFAALFYLFSTEDRPEPIMPADDPCAAAVEVSAETFELYEELVRASSQMTVDTMEWDIASISKQSEKVSELAPDLEESFAEYERYAELCKGQR